jgi:ketosteroid isomerase-like protein
MDTQITSFFQSYDGFWNQRETEAYCNLFLEETTAMFFALNGTQTELNRRGELLEFYIAQFQKLESQPSIQHNTQITRTQIVSPSMALADGEALITGNNAEGQNAILRKWAVAFVLQQTDAGWRILSLRASDRPLA